MELTNENEISVVVLVTLDTEGSAVGAAVQPGVGTVVRRGCCLHHPIVVNLLGADFIVSNQLVLDGNLVGREVDFSAGGVVSVNPERGAVLTEFARQGVL